MGSLKFVVVYYILHCFPVSLSLEGIEYCPTVMIFWREGLMGLVWTNSEYILSISHY